MGSVKDLKIMEEPSAHKSGRGQFIFSDRYSVFDWGEMPDHIDAKGTSICLVTAYFFEKAEEKGINTHYRGIVEDGEAKKISDLKEPSDTLEVDLVNVKEPSVENEKYDYSDYSYDDSNILIPIEIIYRNALPEGSSVFRRLENGELNLEALGLKEEPQPGQKLEPPILDVSTKLEITDRYISWNKAKQICKLQDHELENIKEITYQVNDLITTEAEKIGLSNEDGKIELGFDEDRNIILVDALGTLDESRFTYNGMSVSKEIARKYYRNTDWADEVSAAKKEDRLHWKDKVSSPPALPAEFANLISAVYKAYANELTNQKWFDVPAMDEILNEISKFI